MKNQNLKEQMLKLSNLINDLKKEAENSNEKKIIIDYEYDILPMVDYMNKALSEMGE